MGKVKVDAFLEHVERIYQSQPEYAIGHDGSDGKCDCIGMIKGAMRKAGVEPANLSGTNFAARYGGLNLKPVSSPSLLAKGAVVLKVRKPDDAGYDLPDAYRRGGNKYNGDLNDYSHIGIVTSVNPLVITHMTSPSARKDTKIGKWAYAGTLPQVEYDSGGGGTVEVNYQARVIGGALNMRREPSAKAERVSRIPDGTLVTVTDEAGEWGKTSYSGATGWVMLKWLTRLEPEEEMIQVPRKKLEAFYDWAGDLLGLRG